MTLAVLQVKSELDRMVELYRERQPSRVLEIGVWEGGTLREWLTQTTPDVVVAVDLDHRCRDAYPDWTHDDTQLVVHTGSSQDPATVETMRTFGPYDWVFVDGEHGDEGVGADVRNCLPLVRAGGLMLLHDIVAAEGYPSTGPRHVFESLRGRHELSELVGEPIDYPFDSAHGIGIVHL